VTTSTWVRESHRGELRRKLRRTTGEHTSPLTEGDLDRGRAPDLKRRHRRCSTVDPATGAVCTLRPHSHDEQHRGHQAVQGTSRRQVERCARRGSQPMAGVRL
jgi:hypothetical protein